MRALPTCVKPAVSPQGTAALQLVSELSPCLLRASQTGQRDCCTQLSVTVTPHKESTQLQLLVSSLR